MLKKIFQKESRHQKLAEKYRPDVAAINSLSEDFEKLSDEKLKEKLAALKGKELKEVLAKKNEVFAAVREASARVLEMRHFDVQLLGGLALLDGSIAEMKTGEGKTLVATLPLVLHALTGNGAHLVTVNDYLAKRDAEWMEPVYNFFDLTVGVVIPGMSPQERKEAYGADITYGTNNEFGFDYLRDNMASSVEEMAQRELAYAIVDEVDSILIDEARTPLIISAPDAESTKSYQKFAQIVPQLKENEDYNIDEKRKAATLTDDGVNHVEDILGVDNLYAEGGVREVHHLEQALRATTLYQKDKEYVVKDGEVIIVDEFTGRLMPGRRYSEGLHQAIEAKEKVDVQQESRTLATITFQNYFRLYDTLAGMTGTAITSAEEFEKVYNLDVVEVPTNKEITRLDKTDKIFMTEEAKFKAVMEEIKVRQEKKQPVLVGTIAIEKSEYLAALLNKNGIMHNVLNAKFHEQEAEIITKAGQPGAVTISTNMAGRGTDIKLGEGVEELGGLFVLGTERHEARRIDNQLRGRSGRQGDAGETQFFVSLEDDVMRVFGGERMKNLMEKLKVPEDQPIENKLVTKAIEGAQERVEGYHFDSRKQVLSYDDVLNKQRTAIYTLRKGALKDGVWREAETEELPIADHIPELLTEQAATVVAMHPDEIDEIAETLFSLTGKPIAELKKELTAINDKHKPDGPEEVNKYLTEFATKHLTESYSARREKLGQETFQQLLPAATLRAIDTHWMDHLDTMDYLRTGIGLRGYGQRDPLVEYQKEGYQLFQQMIGTVKTTVVETVFKANIVNHEHHHGEARHESAPAIATAQHPANAGTTPQQARPEQGTIKKANEPNRNDPCPCGSGKKYKKCGLINAPEHK